MGHKYCRPGQRMFVDFTNYQGKVSNLARSKNPDMDRIKQAKEDYKESRNMYNDHAENCHVCTVH